MPKRKRETYDNDADRILSMRKADVQEKLTQSKKLLHRALKTAKGFDRQKLGKRLKLADKNTETENVARINREIEALKGLDLDKATDAHIHRTLLKIKALAESEVLPEEVRRAIPKPEGDEKVVAALHNVTSGMCNTRPVKEVMERVVSGMYIAMGIPQPVGNKAKKGKTEKESGKGILKNGKSSVSKNAESTDEVVNQEKGADSPEELAWKGFGSEDEDADGGVRLELEEQEDDNDDDVENEEDEDMKYASLDEEELSRYDALLGASSSEESFNEEEHIKNRSFQPSSTRLSLSLSPPPSLSPSTQPNQELESDLASPSDSEGTSPPPAKVAKTTKPKSKQEPPKPIGGSTFLPTLMGGYWSGSESEASDLEDDVAAPPVRKNRPGQMARRAIWEKKYGSNAKHIKSGAGSVAEKRGKDDGWDAKRGAKDSNGRGGFGARGRGASDSRAGDRQRDFSKVTGENGMPVGERKGRVLGKKDDAGVLHPSWQAAKKAKEMKKTAKFEGKKVTFD
jgi:hypothetical protein